MENPHEEAVLMIYSTRFEKDERWMKVSLQDETKVPIGRNIAQGISLEEFMVSRNHGVLEKLEWFKSEVSVLT